jgi:Protein of unknown function (DUF2971)
MSQITTLYKYRDWKNPFHKNILTKNELYIPKVSEVNDPFDFKLSLDYNLLETAEDQAKYINILLRDSEKTLRSKGINPDRKKEELKILFANKEQREKLEKEYNEFSNKYIDELFGIYCLSSRWDSILMWTHYSSCHMGFCIGLDKNKLDNSAFFGSHGPVNYQNDFPKIHPLKNNSLEALILQSHTKAKDWQYEDEYRYVKILDNGSNTDDSSKFIFSDDFIKEIILGSRIDDKSKKEITSIAKDKNIPLYQIISSDKEFRLLKVKI